MTDKDQTTGQAAAAVGRCVALFRLNCTDANTRTPWVKYRLLWQEKKILFGRKVVRLKPDQPDRRLRPWVYRLHPSAIKKTCHFVLDHYFYVSWWIFSLLVSMERGMNALQRSYKMTTLP